MVKAKRLTSRLSVAGQLGPSDMASVKAAGFGAVIVNRPDDEARNQPSYSEVMSAADAVDLQVHYLPISGGNFTDDAIAEFGGILDSESVPILAYCRTGTRSTTLWALSEAGKSPVDAILNTAQEAGYDLSKMKQRLEERRASEEEESLGGDKSMKHQIVIVGGGSAGIATAASLLKRKKSLDIAIIEPCEEHYYQPGWTMVGGGIFEAEVTCRSMKDLMPSQVKWIKAAVATFQPDDNTVTLEDGETVHYETLVVAPGLQLDFDKIEGLSETLGQNGVTSNYRYDLAPYTWDLVTNLKSGTAIFTQPPMPIKCAGAPQKAMYLSANHWERSGVLKDIDVKFCNSGGAIFGVAAFVPALMKYVERYDAELNFGETLIKVDGPTKTAWFQKADEDGKKTTVERKFDMLHVTPPQSAPDFIKSSPLANEAGWVDVDQHTLQHNTYKNIFSLGDAGSTPNAKTMAAARKQAPIAASNIIFQMENKNAHANYDGYGACPLTVERGKVVLAEFGYGGKLLPSLPTWMLKGTKPTRLAWFMKDSLLPSVYWNQMLKGKEFLAKPEITLS